MAGLFCLRCKVLQMCRHCLQTVACNRMQVLELATEGLCLLHASCDAVSTSSTL